MPITMALSPPNVGGNVKQNEHPFAAGVNAKQHSHFGRQFNDFLQTTHSHITLRKLKFV